MVHCHIDLFAHRSSSCKSYLNQRCWNHATPSPSLTYNHWDVDILTKVKGQVHQRLLFWEWAGIGKTNSTMYDELILGEADNFKAVTIPVIKAQIWLLQDVKTSCITTDRNPVFYSGTLLVYLGLSVGGQSFQFHPAAFTTTPKLEASHQ